MQINNFINVISFIRTTQIFYQLVIYAYIQSIVDECYIDRNN